MVKIVMIQLMFDFDHGSLDVVVDDDDDGVMDVVVENTNIEVPIVFGVVSGRVVVAAVDVVASAVVPAKF